MLKIVTYLILLIKKLYCIIFIKHDTCYDFSRKTKVLSLKVVFSNGVIVKGDSMSIVMRNDQVVTFQPVFTDAYGNSVDTLGSLPAWSISNPEIGHLEITNDGMTAAFVPTGLKGNTQISLLVDSDPGVEEEALVGTADITVLSGKATVVQLTGVLSNKTEEPVPTPAPEPVEPEVTPEPVPEEPAPTTAPEQEAPVEEPVQPTEPTEPEVTQEPQQ